MSDAERNPASLRVKDEPDEGDQQQRREVIGASLSDDDHDDTPPSLRDYQKEAIAAFHKARRDGLNRIGISAPTGSGKTIIFSTILRRVLDKYRGGKALILDAYGRNRVVIGYEESRARADRRDDVVIATWQTLGRSGRMVDFQRRFKLAHFKLVVVDEAHHSVTNTQLRILGEFNNEVQVCKSNVVSPRPIHDRKAPILGVSATFARNDKRALEWVYQEVVYRCSLEDLWRGGHLAPVRIWKLSEQRRAISGPNRMRVELQEPTNRKPKVKPSSDGQVETEDPSLEAFMRMAGTRSFNEQVLEYYQKQASDRKSTLIFCLDLKYVEDLAKLFVQAGIKAKAVSSKTATGARSGIINDFKTGWLSVLINCMTLSEGFDAPQIDCIILARPTTSAILHTQLIGRTTRPCPQTGKTDCLVIDLVGNCDMFSLGVGPNLTGKRAGPESEPED